MKYGYARCSTNEVKQDIDRQIRELRQQGVERENIYLEYASGAKQDRVELGRLLEAVQEGDQIVATEVSRITRSTQQLCTIIEIAKEKRLSLLFGTFKIDCSIPLDPMNEGMLKMMAVFSEIERNLIRERVRSGMANAKAKGKKIGRPKTSTDNLPLSFYKYNSLYSTDQITKKAFAQLCGVSYPTICKYIQIYSDKQQLK